MKLIDFSLTHFEKWYYDWKRKLCGPAETCLKKFMKSIQVNLFWADLSHSEPQCRAEQRRVKRERGECASEQLKSRFMIHRPSIDKSSSQKFGEGSKSSWERDPCVVNNQRATISSHFVEHSIAANVFFLSSTYIPHVRSMFDWTNRVLNPAKLGHSTDLVSAVT